MAIPQPKVIQPERNSNLNCNSSRYSDIPNIKSIYQRTSKKVRTTSNLSKNTSSRVITQPKVIRPERNSNLNCNSSRYSLIPNIKSKYQRTSKKSPDNLKFKQKYKFKGHNSAKNHSTGTIFELKL